jgi:hypothetical protein
MAAANHRTSIAMTAGNGAGSMSDASPNPAKKRWMEPAVAIVMSLTTLCTTWSSYQSAAWTRRSNSLMNQATALERQAALLDLRGSHTLIVQASVFMQILAAKHSGNEKLMEFYVQRLAPDMKKAYEAWLAQNPYDNPAAAPHPFVPGLYEMRNTAEAAQLRMEATENVAKARKAGSISGEFLANTVLFAAVLFFAAMTGRFQQPRVRWMTVLFTSVLFLFAAARTVVLPTPPTGEGGIHSVRSIMQE